MKWHVKLIYTGHKFDITVPDRETAEGWLAQFRNLKASGEAKMMVTPTCVLDLTQLHGMMIGENASIEPDRLTQEQIRFFRVMANSIQSGEDWRGDER